MPWLYEYILAADSTLADEIQTRGTAQITDYSVGTGHRGLFQIFDGGNEIYATQSYSATGTDRWYLYVWTQLLSSTYPAAVPLLNLWYFHPLNITNASDAGRILYDFGTWDACYIDFYDNQVQARWIRNSNDDGWDLNIGTRGLNGVFTGQNIMQVNYAFPVALAKAFTQDKQ